MRIAVISPHGHNNGATTLAMLLGFELSSNGKTTCVVHSKPISNAFSRYLGFTDLQSFNDKTTTPSQIVKLLKEGGLHGDDVRDYCKQITEDYEAFTNTNSNFNQDDMDYMVEYMAKSFPHEHVVFDVNSVVNLSSDKNSKEAADQRIQNIVDMCDIVILNITQSITDLKRFYEGRERFMKFLTSKPVVVVINKYDPVKGTIKETANWMGIKKPNNWVVLHENSWITWATNHGNLQQLYRKMKDKDKRVIEIKYDLAKICATLVKAKIVKDNQQIEKKNKYSAGIMVTQKE